MRFSPKIHNAKLRFFGRLRPYRLHIPGYSDHEIAAIKDRLLNLHVFHSSVGTSPFPRLPLSEGSNTWKPCLAAADEAVAPAEFAVWNAYDG